MKFFFSYVPIMFLKFSMHSTTMFLIGPQFIPNPLPKVLPYSLIYRGSQGGGISSSHRNCYFRKPSEIQFLLADGPIKVTNFKFLKKTELGRQPIQ
jgi:hypothetical protein